MRIQNRIQNWHEMQSKVRHLHQDKRGRYHARMGVPRELREIIGKRELIKALGGDRIVALRSLPKTVAQFQDLIDQARDTLLSSENKPNSSQNSAPLSIEEIAANHYRNALRFDDKRRAEITGYSSVGIDDGYVANVKAIYAGRASLDLIEGMFGNEIELYQKRGQHTFQRGSAKWRQLASHLALSELEVLKRMFERDEGNLTSETPGWIEKIQLEQAAASKEDGTKNENKHTLLDLFKMCRRAKTGNNELTDRTSKAFLKPVKNFIDFAKTDDPSKITNLQISQWIEHLQFANGLSPKTIKSRYLTAIKHTLRWAANQGYIEPVTLTASISVPKKQYDREKGYTASEAAAVLQYARDYQRPEKSRESQQMSAAKRWAHWLLYFTGARIGEVAQLRKQDVRTEKGISYIHITPEAGTTKNNKWRDVPLHNQILEQGFLDFVKNAPEGPLFFPLNKPDQDRIKSAATTSQRLCNGIKNAGLVPKDVNPNHGFRHTFKTLARRYNIPVEYMHAIQGHATNTAGQEYGNVDIATMKREIDKLPPINCK